jgi:hypothetical protein
LDTDAFGNPIGSPIWESPDFEAIGARQEYTFLPKIVTTMGEQYFIGVDSGLLTNVGGGDFTIQASADTLGGGEFWHNEYDTVFSPLTGGDVRTTIRTSFNPEPTTGLLVGLGLVLMSMSRRKSRSGSGPH